MTAGRRTVRATPRFFADLDRQLPTERGPNGEPSTNDFQVLDLLRVVERFAVEWDDLPELIPGRSQYRILIAAGNVVARFAVVEQLAPDGAVELVQLVIDPESTWWQFDPALEHIDDDLTTGAVAVITDKRIRIRRLPLLHDE